MGTHKQTTEIHGKKLVTIPKNGTPVPHIIIKNPKEDDASKLSMIYC